MVITLTWQNVITAGAVVGALAAIIGYFVKLILWVNKQDQQDKEIANLKTHHDEDIKAIKGELELLMFGVQACLKGLAAQGCNGQVTEALEKFEGYLNKKAHK